MSEAQRSTSPFLVNLASGLKDKALYESFDSESDEELIELIKGYLLPRTFHWESILSAGSLRQSEQIKSVLSGFAVFGTLAQM